MNKVLWWWCGIAISCAASLSAQDIRLLIVDTNSKEPYYYRNILLLAESVGFKTDYRSLYDIMQNPDIEQYDALFFMISPAMISAETAPLPRWLCNKLFCFVPAQPRITIPEKCLNALRSFTQQPGKAIALIFPGGQYSPVFKQKVEQTIKQLALASTTSPELLHMIQQYVSYIGNPDTLKGALFGTGLLNKSGPIIPLITDSKGNAINQIQQENGFIQAQLVPIHTDRYSPLAQKALPTGLLIQIKEKENIYLISKLTEFDFADIAEHFFKNPLAITDRNELLKATQETLQAFYYACKDHHIPKKLPPVSLPSQFMPHYLAQEKQRITAERSLAPAYHWISKEGISAAWLDPYDFFAHEDAHQKLKSTILNKNNKLSDDQVKQAVEDLALKRGIRIIYDGGFNLLWFEFIPEWYLSPHGLRKEQKQEYTNRIIRLGKELKEFYAKNNTPLPKVFVGLNLTSNFKTYPVCNPIRTIFGTELSKIPSPFDMEHFWHPEVIDVFRSFVSEFKNYLPIDGVFFDFEMYHAPQQTGLFTNQMDFSDTAWQIFVNQSRDKKAAKINSHKKRIDYLQKHKRFKQYFMILEQEADRIGTILKQKLRAIVPNLLFAAYSPHILQSWFYRGLMAGLSSASEPLILVTFNTDFVSHYRWLIKHNVHLLHGTAIMLSKLQHTTDASLLSSQSKYHDFLWFNRPSRMIYSYNQNELDRVWWGSEASPTATKTVLPMVKNTCCKTAQLN